MKRLIKRFLKASLILLDFLRSLAERKDISIFHELLPPPDGGGNQFIRALAAVFESKGFRVVFNRITPSTKLCFYNSFNFDPLELKFWRRIWGKRGPFIHRVDGPIKVYRGFDDGADAIVWDYNRKYATHSILQSQYSLDKHLKLGVHLVNPHLVSNASDSTIFFPPPSRKPILGRKARIIATSWSNNPNKGKHVYRWLDANLDHDRFEFVFAGRIEGSFENARHLGALDSCSLAKELRAADIYLTASKYDPCSNSLIEALTCGLPAIYLNSGGHPEIVGEGGLPFDHAEDIPALLDKLLEGYNRYQGAIRVNSMAIVAERYLAIAGLGEVT